MRRFLQWRKGDAVLLGEANVLPAESKKFFGEEGDGIHLMFNFYVNQYTFYALATSDTKPLDQRLWRLPGISLPAASGLIFYEITMSWTSGRLTEEERRESL
jgi:maltose alpha-D-glucosyltransferase/alpha-amylase